jgi:5-methylcytosine-specific restriction endonuclease McrA
MNYQEYLHSEKWREKKNTLYRHRQYECYICKQTYDLQVHHMTYKRLGNERRGDLVYLCRECHEEVTDRAKRRNMSHGRATKQMRKSARVCYLIDHSGEQFFFTLAVLGLLALCFRMWA